MIPEDPEITAIRGAYEVLRQLDTAACERVVRWLTDRLKADHLVDVQIEEMPF